MCSCGKCSASPGCILLYTTVHVATSRSCGYCAIYNPRDCPQSRRYNCRIAPPLRFTSPFVSLISNKVHSNPQPCTRLRLIVFIRCPDTTAKQGLSYTIGCTLVRVHSYIPALRLPWASYTKLATARVRAQTSVTLLVVLTCVTLGVRVAEMWQGVLDRLTCCVDN